MKIIMKKGGNTPALILKDVYGAILGLLNSIFECFIYITSTEYIKSYMEKACTRVTIYRIGFTGHTFITSYTIPHEITQKESTESSK